MYNRRKIVCKQNAHRCGCYDSCRLSQLFMSSFPPFFLILSPTLAWFSSSCLFLFCFFCLTLPSSSFYVLPAIGCLSLFLSGSCRGDVSRFMTNTAGITRRPRDCCWSSIRSGVSAHVYWWELVVQMCTYTYDLVSIIASVEVSLHGSLIADFSSEMLLIRPANL